jgi:hypothetical protein
MPLPNAPLVVTVGQDGVAGSVADELGANSTSNAAFAIHGTFDQILAGGATVGVSGPESALSFSALRTFIATLTLPVGATDWTLIPDGWRRSLLNFVKAIALGIRQVFENVTFLTSQNIQAGLSTDFNILHGVTIGMNFLQLPGVYTITAAQSNTLPTPTSQIVGYVAITSNGGPVNTGSVGGVPVFTSNTGAPGMVFVAFDGAAYHWYNTVGTKVI